jgi:hypothetical protein
MDQNRKFAEMNGLLDECDCGNSLCRYPISDFSDPREVLKVVRMKPLKEYAAFLNSGVGCYDYAEPKAGIPNACEMIEVDYLTTPSKLRDAWIEWKEPHNPNPGC